MAAKNHTVGNIVFPDGTVQTTAATGGGGTVNTVAAPGAAVDSNALVISGANISAEYADATHPGIISTGAQTIPGAKTMAADLTLAGDLVLTSSASGVSGSNANIPAHSSPFVRLTNAGLVSVASADITGVADGHVLLFHNNTGNAITIVNNYASAPANSGIYTGYGANIVIPAEGSWWMSYDGTSDHRWEVVGATTNGTAITSLTGDVTGTGPGAAAATIAGQGGNSGKFLTTNGTSTSWAAVSVAQNRPDLYGCGYDGAQAAGFGSMTLSKDMHWTNLTFQAGDKINTNGFRIFCSGTLDMSHADSGAITYAGHDGNSATSSVGGAAVSGFRPNNSNCTIGNNGNTPQAGASGTTSVGGNGLGTSNNITANGGNSYNSGKGGNGSAGGGGNAGSVAGLPNRWPTYWFTPYMFKFVNGTGTLQTFTIDGGLAGSGGGGGGGDNTNSGGGGGSGAIGGGVMYLGCNVIARGTNSNAGIITVKGGNGGSGFTPTVGNCGGGGGGSGGGGGWLMLCYNTLTGSVITNCIDASGGSGGSGGAGHGTGTAGTGGGAGDSALVQIYGLSDGTNFVNVPGGGAAQTPGTQAGVTNTVRINL